MDSSWRGAGLDIHREASENSLRDVYTVRPGQTTTPFPISYSSSGDDEALGRLIRDTAAYPGPETLGTRPQVLAPPAQGSRSLVVHGVRRKNGSDSGSGGADKEEPWAFPSPPISDFLAATSLPSRADPSGRPWLGRRGTDSRSADSGQALAGPLCLAGPVPVSRDWQSPGPVGSLDGTTPSFELSHPPSPPLSLDGVWGTISAPMPSSGLCAAQTAEVRGVCLPDAIDADSMSDYDWGSMDFLSEDSHPAPSPTATWSGTIVTVPPQEGGSNGVGNGSPGEECGEPQGISAKSPSLSLFPARHRQNQSKKEEKEDREKKEKKNNDEKKQGRDRRKKGETYCVLCHHDFSDASGLRRHRGSGAHRGKGARRPCPACGKPIMQNRKDNLNRHLRLACGKR